MEFACKHLLNNIRCLTNIIEQHKEQDDMQKYSVDRLIQLHTWI